MGGPSLLARSRGGWEQSPDPIMTLTYLESRLGEFYVYGLYGVHGVAILSKDGPFGDARTPFAAKVIGLKQLGTPIKVNGTTDYIAHTCDRIEPLSTMGFAEVGVLFY